MEPIWAPFLNFMKLFKRIAIIIFLIACFTTWTIMTLIDTGAVHGMSTKWLKFGTIAMCFVFSLIHCKNVKSHLFIGAMLFTMISDWILVLCFNYKTIWIALVTFSISQIFHMLDMKEMKNLKWTLIRRAILFVLLSILVCVLNGFNVISILTAFYAANLILNIVDASRVKIKGHVLMVIGFILFLLCDICVGWAMSQFTGNIKPLDYFAGFGMWLFYVPSQALLVFANYYRFEK